MIKMRGHFQRHMVVSLNYCSQNGGNLYRAPYYNGNPNMGPLIDSNLDQSPYMGMTVGLWLMGVPSREHTRNVLRISHVRA